MTLTSLSTQRFSDRADVYAAARPGYPAALVPLLRDALALPPGAVVADLGSGTGLSCLPFLQAGCTVFGVEPNAAMRAAGERFLAGHAAFRSVAGTAEATTLPDASVDLVIAAQAAHWFDATAARREAQRILRRPPRAALIWNERIATGSPFAEGFEQLLREFGTDYATIRARHAHPALVNDFFGHARVGRATLPNPTRIDWPTLVARVQSASYMPTPQSPAYAPMLARLRALYEAAQDNGRVPMDYETIVFYGTLA
ncbi:MAG: class I SAM-dependent methyltransferase [Burkholderiaceae bacterium]|nr:class I SAM-dependent methyltransferase [Burkholderiaceae bacterium]